MTYRLLAGSCDGGPCPTFRIDDLNGDVKVQGYVTDSPVPLPVGEDVVYIPADAWRLLLSGLPVHILLNALLGRLRRPVVTLPLPQYR